MLIKILSYDVYARIIRVGKCQFIYYTEPFKEKVFFIASDIFERLFWVGEIDTVSIMPSSREEGRYILTGYTVNIKKTKRSEKKNYR